MDEKRVNIDVEVIKKPKICDICCIEASIYESPLQETAANHNKWQSLIDNIKNKIIRKKVRKNGYLKEFEKKDVCKK